MGLTSEIFSQENCLNHQSDCLQEPNGNGDQNADYDFEVPPNVLDDIDFYAKSLAVPARRNAYDTKVQRGKQVFINTGCVACHTPEYVTKKSALNIEQSEQKIFPYTDLLLHDMGEDLADFNLNNEPVSQEVSVEYAANAREWRTPPLWGIGLAKIVNPKASFLHDGRARTLMEAILWHGGEAEDSRNKVLNLDKNSREALILFLEDL